MSKILVVDDEEMMLMIARHILSRKYEVITATSGAEAIKLFESEHPDMVLSDLMMPEMDGYELHRILQEKSAEPVPIMFMTADESSESESKGFEVGAEDYIRKPLKPDVLLRRVGIIIEHLDEVHGLKAAAAKDPLTKLFNKTSAQREIGELLKKSSGALLMIDLDSFKLVNDIYGHTAGDKILVRFAELIKDIMREKDLAGRMGGDEFVAFLQNVSDEKILQEKTRFLNEEILKSAREMFGENMEIPLGTSIGAVLVPDEGRDFQKLYEKADKALYEVKQHGKHGISIYNASKKTRKEILAGILQTQMILSERNVELGAYYVEFEDFKKIYQLMSRIATEYNRNVVLIQITLLGEEYLNGFKEILIDLLRKSDCVTCSGKKFLILLTESTERESAVVKSKIISKLGVKAAYKMIFEHEKVN